MKTYTERINAKGERENILINEDTHEITILGTTPTRESKIKATALFTEEQKAFLLELFK